MASKKTSPSTRAGTTSASRPAARKASSAARSKAQLSTKSLAVAVMRKPKPSPGVRPHRAPSAEQIAEMTAEATVDAYGEDEVAVGWHTAIADNLDLPFTTEVLGQEVQVVEIDLRGRNEIVAVCQKGKQKLRMLVVDLPLPEPPPDGYEWIEAYRHWGG